MPNDSPRFDETSRSPVATPPLDDVMLAMDVVDTLRHERRLVEQELGVTDRDRQLVARLREIYAAQGIDVPDEVLEQGVDALREDRFVYVSPARGLGRSLQVLYVTRGRWGKRGIVAAILVLAAAGAIVLL